jgi:hypothetical protein
MGAVMMVRSSRPDTRLYKKRSKTKKARETITARSC